MGIQDFLQAALDFAGCVCAGIKVGLHLGVYLLLKKKLDSRGPIWKRRHLARLLLPSPPPSTDALFILVKTPLALKDLRALLMAEGTTCHVEDDRHTKKLAALAPNLACIMFGVQLSQDGSSKALG